MKYTLFHIRMLVLGGGALMCIALAYGAAQSLFAVNSYTFSYDPLITTACQDRIAHLIKKSKITNPCALQELILSQCNAIEAITVERSAHRSFHIELSSVVPALLLNDNWVLSQQGSIVPKHFFEDFAVAARAVITMPDVVPLHVSWRFKQWLMNIDPALLQRYSISWVNDYQIFLQDKEHTNVSLVCSAQDQLDESRLAAWQRIQKELDERIPQKGGASTRWLADLRFDKQIIVCPSSQGGACYG